MNGVWRLSRKGVVSQRVLEGLPFRKDIVDRPVTKSVRRPSRKSV